MYSWLQTFKQEDEKQDKEKVVQEDELRIHDSTDSSDDEAKGELFQTLVLQEVNEQGWWCHHHQHGDHGHCDAIIQ